MSVFFFFLFLNPFKSNDLSRAVYEFKAIFKGEEFPVKLACQSHKIDCNNPVLLKAENRFKCSLVESCQSLTVH